MHEPKAFEDSPVRYPRSAVQEGRSRAPGRLYYLAFGTAFFAVGSVFSIAAVAAIVTRDWSGAAALFLGFVFYYAGFSFWKAAPKQH